MILINLDYPIHGQALSDERVGEREHPFLDTANSTWQIIPYENSHQAKCGVPLKGSDVSTVNWFIKNTFTINKVSTLGSIVSTNDKVSTYFKLSNKFTVATREFQTLAGFI